MPTTATRSGLSGNQLKILAMIFMTIDHVGLMLLPDLGFLRLIGRLALPIFAYMIAEGCRYTSSRGRYLARLAGLAALCQVVYFFAMDSLYMCILVTFSLSVCLIWVLDYGEEKKNNLVPAVVALGIFALCRLLPLYLPGFDVDYGFGGILLPVLIYFGKDKGQSLIMLTLGLVLIAADRGGIQWLSLAAVPILAFYNGSRGTRKIGPLFYWYYPLHLAVIYGISLFF